MAADDRRATAGGARPSAVPSTSMDDDHTQPVPGEPTGASTLLEALDQLRAAGYERDMWVTPDGLVRCGVCHHEAAPLELDLQRLVRLEGVSDPGEEAAVLALRCKACGALGTAVVRFGPEADAQDVAVLRAVEDHRR